LTDKKVLLKLYNALNETDYNDENELEITTLENVIYMGYKNDLSFIIGNTINLYEHQSTICPNLPLRGLRYISLLYNVYMDMADENIYGTKLISLPRPQCIVFYNGTEYQEEQRIMRLSDAYQETAVGKFDSHLEFVVTVLNINFGNNKELLSKCRELEDYSRFIYLLREYTNQGLNMKTAMRRTIDECIKQDILRDILLQNEAGVMDMMLTKYNKKAHMRVIREEGREEGIEIGKAQSDEKWAKVVTEKDAVLSEKDVALSEKDALIKELTEKLGQK